MTKSVACVGDVGKHGSSHPGTITGSGQDGSVKAEGVEIAVVGASYHCSEHGSKIVSTAVTTKSFINGKLIITEGARTSCGATILATGRSVSAE